MPVKLSELIPPHFHQFYYDFMADRYTHYKQPGGRGSAKSSTDGILIPLKMTQHPNRNAVVLRRVGNTLRTSVVNQVLWGIEQLGMSHLWKFNQSTMEMTYLPTGQQIFFRGADDPQKIKSIKPKKGYIGIRERCKRCFTNVSPIICECTFLRRQDSIRSQLTICISRNCDVVAKQLHQIR